MSFRIAELITRGESDEASRAEVTEIILRLWERRSSWPDGWPPTSARRQLSWLFGPGHHGHPQPTDSTARFMVRVAKSLSEEYAFWLWASSATPEAEDDIGPTVFGSYTPWSERRLLRRLEELMRLATELGAEEAQHGAAQVAPDRNRVARDELTSLLRTRRGMLDEAFKLASLEMASVENDAS